MGTIRTTRTTRSSRWCYRYRYAIYLALFFVVFQIVVAINFLSLDSQEQKKQNELNALPREERQADSGAHGSWINSKMKFRIRPDLVNGDYDGNQPAGHSAVNKDEDNLLLLHQQKLTKVPSDGKNAPSDKEAYRTNLKAAEGGLQIKNIGKIADDAETKKGLNVVNRETDSRHAHIFHSTFNSSDPSRDKSNGKLGRLEEWERPPTPPATYYPKCSITRSDVEPYSAISRATTSECKQDIADIVCKMKQGTLYPMKMPRFCPVEGKPLKEVDNLDEVNLSPPSSVRIAYIFVVNGRALRQVRRLIKLLYHSNHFFYIHVDKRSDYLHRELSKIADMFPNILMTPWRYATIWGGASLLSVYLQAMQDLLKMEDLKWDFIINLSESDFPIKTNAQLVKFLGHYRQNNFLKSHGRDESSRFIKKQGLDRTFIECDNHMWRIGDRKLPEGIVYDGGSDWFALNREYCQYLLTANNTMVNGLKEMFKYSLLPAESFFHLVLVNSEHCETMIDNNLHITNWKRKLGCQCQYKHIVDWCGCSPNVFKPEDFYKVKNSRPVYFSRKFEPVVSLAVINQVDTFLYSTYPMGTPGMNTYFQSIYHEEDTLTLASDGEMTTYRAFLRVLKETVNLNEQPTDKNCSLKISDMPHEVSGYYRMDSLKGLIVTARAVDSLNHTQMVEAFFPLSNLHRILNIDGPGGRLKRLEVGLNFDAKERIFRKYGNIMGPYDSPTFASMWVKGSEYSITITWIDPANHIAASFDTTIEADREELHHQPPFNKPLRPGKWTLKILYQWEVVAEVNFLIVPLSTMNNKELSPSKLFETNSGPLKNNYVGKDFSPLRSVFDLEDNSALLAEANRNSKKSGSELVKWIDDSIKTFWSVSGFCLHKQQPSPRSSCPQLKVCTEYAWSTFSLDIKSHLGKVNAFGRIR